MQTDSSSDKISGKGNENQSQSVQGRDLPSGMQMHKANQEQTGIKGNNFESHSIEGREHKRHAGNHSRSKAGLRSIRNRAFLAIMLVFVGIVFFLIFGIGYFYENLLLIVFLAFVFFFIWKYDYILQLKEYERAVVYTFGHAKGVVGPGWVLVFPPIQSFTKVDLRTKVIDIPPQNVVTKDGVEVKIDGLIYLRVKKDKESVLKSVIEVQDYEHSATSYVVALLRDAIGGVSLTDVITNVVEIDVGLKKQLEKIASAWGVEIEEVKIQQIIIPETVLSAMHEEKAALQKKLARFQKAAALEREIEVVKNAAQNLSDKALAYYYVRALEKLGSSSSTKFVFPLELTKLVEAVSGKNESKENLEALFQKYKPVLDSLELKNKTKNKKTKT